MPSNARLKTAALEAFRQRDNAIDVKNDMIRALCAVVNKFGGRVSIPEELVHAINSGQQIHFYPNAKLREIIITTTPDAQQPSEIAG